MKELRDTIFIKEYYKPTLMMVKTRYCRRFFQYLEKAVSAIPVGLKCETR